MSDEPVRAARARHGWWPGWIWSVPVAAALLLAWFLVRALTQGGPDVSVVFPVIADIKADNTVVTFEGFKVGQVSGVTLEPDLRHLRVKLDLQADLSGHLGKGTQFWIIGQSPSLTNISGLKTLVTGPSIGIKPAPGPKQDQYEGLAEDPVLGFGAKGTTFTLRADKLGSVKAHTPIFYSGERVGVVKSTAMSGPHGFVIEAFIGEQHAPLVHDGTRFWRAGPVHVAATGNGLTVQFQSVDALFQGAIAFETPDGATQGPVAEAGRGFVLHDDENAARHAPDQEGVAYRVTFAPADEVPPVNAPVMLMGKQVGSVTQSALQYDPQRRQIGVNATLVLEPRTIELPGGAAWSDPRAQMDDMLRALVEQGLRAELGRSPPVVGGAQVTLSIKPGPPGALGEGAVPEIPAAPGSGDISGVVAQAHDIMGKIDAIPFRRIADNVDAASAHLARIAGSPELKGTLIHVDRASADLEHVAVDLRRNLPSALASLRTALAQARSALASAQALLSARGTTASAPGSGDLPRMLYEITRAARSLRELADLLDRDPSALLTGKGRQQ